MSSQLLHMMRVQVGSYYICLIDVLEHIPQEADCQEEHIQTPYLHDR